MSITGEEQMLESASFDETFVAAELPEQYDMTNLVSKPVISAHAKLPANLLTLSYPWLFN